MQSLSKIDFRIPSKLIGDYNQDSFQLTPNMETESGLGTDDDLNENFSENVTPHNLKQKIKSRQSPNPSQVVASKLKKKRTIDPAETVSSVSPML
jgi:hypothetical protein